MRLTHLFLRGRSFYFVGRSAELSCFRLARPRCGHRVFCSRPCTFCLGDVTRAKYTRVQLCALGRTMSSRGQPDRDRVRLRPRRERSGTINAFPSNPTKKQKVVHLRKGGVNQKVKSSRNNEFLFFGDSLTYGMSHNSAERYFLTWPQLLRDRIKTAIKGDYHIVESALCSRTTDMDDVHYDNKTWLPNMTPHIFNGKTALAPILLSHSPRWCIILLGTNNLKQNNVHAIKTAMKKMADKTPYGVACAVAKSCCELGKMARSFHPHVKVLIVTPPPIRLTVDNQTWGFNQESVKIAAQFPKAFAAVCKEGRFLNACCPSRAIDMRDSEDGIHITEDHNVTYADAVWNMLSKHDQDLPRHGRLAIV